MSDIDVERLKWDADYWDEVAPEEATTYDPTKVFGYPSFMKNTDHEWKYFSRVHQEWIPHTGGERDQFIPRPTKQEWEGGLPTVDCKCQFIHPGIKSHGWQTGVIKAYFDDRVVIQSNPLIWEPNGIAVILIDSELKFRPLKSKQERQREELAELVRAAYLEGASDHAGGLSAVVDALIADGWKKEPKP